MTTPQKRTPFFDRMVARALGTELLPTLRRPSLFEPDAEPGPAIGRVTADGGTPGRTAFSRPPRPGQPPAQDRTPRPAVPRSRPDAAAPEAAPAGHPAAAAAADVAPARPEPPGAREVRGDAAAGEPFAARELLPLREAVGVPVTATGPSATVGAPAGVTPGDTRAGQRHDDPPGGRPDGAATAEFAGRPEAGTGRPDGPPDSQPAGATATPPGTTPGGGDLDPIWLVREHVLPILVERGALRREQPADVLPRARAPAPGRAVVAVTAGRAARTGAVSPAAGLPPEVHVHIDRIEVHHPPEPAAPAPRPAQATQPRRPRPAPRPPAADLGAYLARRRGGR